MLASELLNLLTPSALRAIILDLNDTIENEDINDSDDAVHLSQYMGAREEAKAALKLNTGSDDVSAFTQRWDKIVKLLANE